MSRVHEKAGKARMLLVDDHAFMRAGIRAILGRDASLEVVGEAQDGEEALACCRELRPDLVLMDVSMPRMSGIEATRRIKTEFPLTSVLILTAHADHRLLKEAVRAGAAGYLLKNGDTKHVLDAIRAVLEGDPLLDQEKAMHHVMKGLALEEGSREKSPIAYPPEGPTEPLKGTLSAQETEVLRLIALGRTNRQIAQGLHVSLSSVKTYVQRVIRKLGVSDRTQASVRAVEEGLLDEEG